MKTHFALSLSVFAARLLAAEPSSLPPSQTIDAAPASTARLTVLFDNTTKRPDLTAAWGFSCLVEFHGHTVLFDTGADPEVFKHNVAALKIDPSKIEAVIISHVHIDHTGGAPGLGSLSDVPAYIPGSFDDSPKEKASLEAAHLKLVPVTTAISLGDGLAIAQPMPFDRTGPFSRIKKRLMDPLWEQCLTVDTPEGLVVVVGCAHPGIVSMLEQVKRSTGRPLYFVIGGFHLARARESEVREIASAMQAMGVANVAATHCTGSDAEKVFRSVFREHYFDAGVGRAITLPISSPKP
jgi:7,8-dihydropterin-6-yl-methyl-4-(beta-D-ribofuranosyl)aminobenzene 5'-phosphate synthase